MSNPRISGELVTTQRPKCASATGAGVTFYAPPYNLFPVVMIHQRKQRGVTNNDVTAGGCSAPRPLHTTPGCPPRLRHTGRSGPVSETRRDGRARGPEDAGDGAALTHIRIRPPARDHSTAISQRTPRNGRRVARARRGIEVRRRRGHSTAPGGRARGGTSCTHTHAPGRLSGGCVSVPRNFTT